jgi:membrane-associated phospholipid phosphatase
VTALNHASSSGSGLYDAITSLGVHSPGFLQGLMLAYTKYGLVLIVPLFAWVWWQARLSGSSRRMALALLAPAGTLVAYLFSEILKTMVHEERPCRGLPVTSIIGKCPDPGDWSFPSNHSVLAASAALGAVYAWRRAMPWLFSLAALMAFSRVFVGAHFPHDVLAGLFFGAAFAWLAHRFVLDRATDLVDRFAGRVPWRLLGTPAEAEDEPYPDDDRTELIGRVPAGPGPRHPGERPPAGGPERRDPAARYSLPERRNPAAERPPAGGARPAPDRQAPPARGPVQDRRTRPLPEPRPQQQPDQRQQQIPARRQAPVQPQQPPVNRPVRPRPDQPPAPQQRPQQPPQQRPPRPR